MDFAFFLLLATVLSAACWIYWRTIIRPSAPDGADALDGSNLPERIVVFLAEFFPVLLLVFVLRSFVVEPFRIPSGSMLPTLEIGDFILVNKFSYGLRMPVFNTTLLDLGSPERGDVMVFRYPRNTRTDYIKRVIGLPGDRIAYYRKQLYINGQPVPKEMLPDLPDDQSLAPSLYWYRESLDEVEHDIWIHSDRSAVIQNSWQVPEGHYFVMGDNRDNSEDSRYWGFVPEKNLVGKAFLVWMNWNSNQRQFQWERIGHRIR